MTTASRYYGGGIAAALPALLVKKCLKNNNQPAATVPASQRKQGNMAQCQQASASKATWHNAIASLLRHNDGSIAAARAVQPAMLSQLFFGNNNQPAATVPASKAMATAHGIIVMVPVRKKCMKAASNNQPAEANRNGHGSRQRQWQRQHRLSGKTAMALIKAKWIEHCFATVCCSAFTVVIGS